MLLFSRRAPVPAHYRAEENRTDNEQDKDSPRSVLIVEDEGLIALDLKGRLQRAGYVVPAIANSADSAFAESERFRPSIVLMDIRLSGDTDGIAAADRIRKQFRIPVIFVTAHADPQTLDRARRSEPFGYIVKPFHNIDFRAQIEVAIWKHRMERNLRDSEAWLCATLGNVADGLIATDVHGNIIFMNEPAALLTGRNGHTARGLPLLDVLPLFDDRTALPVLNPLDSLYDNRELPSGTLTCRLTRPFSSNYMLVDVEFSANRADGELLGVIAVFRDATERRRAQEQGRAAQKMNALKRMAAGLGGELEQSWIEMDACISELLSEAETAAHTGESLLRRLAEAHKRSLRRQGLVQQLIALGRSEPEPAEPVDLNHTIRSEEARLRRILGSQNSLQLELEASLPLIAVSSHELRNHIRTLILNAQEAMPAGGEVTVSTRSWSELDSQPWVLLSVRDTGKPIPEADLPRVFDPWSQARPGVRRTGISLALLYQFTVLYGGAAEVRSRRGEGVTYVLSFPALISSAPRTGPALPGGAE